MDFNERLGWDSHSERIRTLSLSFLANSRIKNNIFSNPKGPKSTENRDFQGEKPPKFDRRCGEFKTSRNRVFIGFYSISSSYTAVKNFLEGFLRCYPNRARPK